MEYGYIGDCHDAGTVDDNDGLDVGRHASHAGCIATINYLHVLWTVGVRPTTRNIRTTTFVGMAYK